MSLPLRPYQQTAFDAVQAGWATFHRQLGVAATGAGKTILFSHLAAASPGATLILCHRKELIKQAVAKLQQATGIFARVEAGSQRTAPGHGVVVASVQTMARRMVKYPRDAFQLIICDECHHVTGDEWQAVLEHFSSARVLGVTATPNRSDKRTLGKFFQNVAFEISLLQLIGDGFLAPLRAKKLEVEVPMAALSRRRKDVTEEEASNAVQARIKELAGAVAGEVWDRKALVFLPRCDVSAHFAELLQSHGIEARHVAGDSKDQEETLAWFAEPGRKTLCNAMLLTEGYDNPEVDAICCLRATKSQPLYSQIVGRMLRLYPGKEYGLLLDPLWLSGEIELCRPADLIAATPEHRVALQAHLDDGLELTEAEAIARADVEELMAKQLTEAKRKKAPKGLIDPLAWAVGIHDSNLTEYEAAMPWEEEPPTAEQLAELNRLSLWTENMTRGYAVKLLERAALRESLGLASPKQVMKLRQLGDPNADTVTKGQAGYIIGKRFGR